MYKFLIFDIILGEVYEWTVRINTFQKETLENVASTRVAIPPAATEMIYKVIKQQPIEHFAVKIA